MKRNFRSTLCIIMCFLMMFTYTATASAATLAKVKNLKATSVTAGTVKLKWSKVSGAKGYRVYRYNSGSKKWVAVKKTTELTYSDSTVSGGKTYSYKVRAYKTSKGKTVYGSYSSVLKVKTPPSKVQNLKTSSVGATSLTLKWSAAKGASGYKVYSYDSAKKKYVSVADTKKTSLTIKKLSSATAYKYKVRAYKISDGKKSYGSYSSVLSVATLPAKVKTLKASSVGTTSAVLNWTAVKGAAGYKIYRYDSAEKKYVSVADTKSTSCTVKNLSGGTSYSFKVRAYHKLNSTVYGAYSEVCSFRTNLEAVKGLAVSDVTSDSVTLKWSAVKGVSGYQIARYNTQSKSWRNIATTAATTYKLTGVTPGSSEQYKVRAFLKNGSVITYGGYSASVTATALPGVPTNLAGDANSDSGITLSWRANGKSSGYEVFRYNALDGTWNSIGKTVTNHYRDNTLKDTSEYMYKVRSYSIRSGKTVYSDFTSSVTVYYKSPVNPDNIYSQELQDKGIFGYLFDPDGLYFYTAGDPWQRNFGFNSIYDVLAPFTMINYDTVRLRFEYGNKDWMVQLWKGQYGLIFYGGEVGVYTKPKNRVIMHYDCASDDELLKMTMTFSEKKTSLTGKTSWRTRFTRPYGDYWWCTGFLPGFKYGRFDELRLDLKITMKDQAMLSGFKKALEENKITYTVSGLDVSFSY